MNGNPHYSTAAKSNAQLVSEETANEHYVAEVGLTDETMQFSALNRIAEATLAVAYEQRTANLMSMYKLMRDEGNTDVPEYDELARNMAIRLGMLPTT